MSSSPTAFKVHRHLIESLAPVLLEIFHSQASVEAILEKTFKAHRKWGSRDRKFFAEQVYDLIRWWRKLWFLLDAEPSFAVTQIIRLWGTLSLVKDLPLPVWEELQNLNLSPEKKKIAESDRSLRESVPLWFDQLGDSEWNEKWPAILQSLNQPAPVDLRVNQLLAKPEQVKKQLVSEGIETERIENCPFGLSLKTRKNVRSSKAFLSGLFEIQDRASQLVAPFLEVESGQTVIDACAGAGGKSLHLAALMNNRGRILSCDIHAFKLKETKIRAQRNGARIIDTFLIQKSEDLTKLAATADRLLLDVPCSGSGVLRRKPMDKWRLNPENLQQVQALQSRILEDYSSLVKPGGLMVYSTCSFLKLENELQIEKFLSGKSGVWKLEDQIRINPNQEMGDGFFAARLKRLS